MLCSPLSFSFEQKCVFKIHLIWQKWFLQDSKIHKGDFAFKSSCGFLLLSIIEAQTLPKLCIGNNITTLLRNEQNRISLMLKRNKPPTINHGWGADDLFILFAVSKNLLETGFCPVGERCMSGGI